MFYKKVVVLKTESTDFTFTKAFWSEEVTALEGTGFVFKNIIDQWTEKD